MLRTINKKLFCFACFLIFSNAVFSPTENLNPLANPKIYKRGFLYSLTNPSVIPFHYQRINKHLWVDKSLEVARSSDQTLVIFGLAVDIRNANINLNAIANNLANALNISEKNFHCECDFICGRYAVIYKTHEGAERIVTDATGMRAIYHSQDAKLITGHTKLLADNLAGKFIKPIQSNIQNGYPGRLTPYAGVFTLIPNTSVTIGSGAISRFYPRGPLQPLSVDKVVAKTVPWLTNALIGAKIRKPLAVSLTAGIDSRTTMAIEHHINQKNSSLYFTYNFINPPLEKTLRDVKMAKYIAQFLKIQYKTIDEVVIEPNEEEKMTFTSNTFFKHNPGVALALVNEFNDQFIHIRSQLCEIGRAFYAWAKVSSTMPDWSFQLAKKQFRNSFEDDTLRAILEDYVKTTQLDQKALYNYDCRDIYYWEQRMATWASQIFLETDIAYETFIPWNARAIFTTLLQIPFEDRKNATVFKKIIEMFCPEIKDLPINPATWPMENTDSSQKKQESYLAGISLN